MAGEEHFLKEKLAGRKSQGNFRSLPCYEQMVDFCSNDYLGLSRTLATLNIPGKQGLAGATGSRLISGNSSLAEETESRIAAFHHAEAALLFNTGYLANVGLLSSVAGKEDTVLHDEFVHASILDGIRLSGASRRKFSHNHPGNLENQLQKSTGRVFVIIESVYSMEGDIAPLREFAAVSKKYGALLVVDEAHASGVFGKNGEGLVAAMNLQDSVFARVITFGKALGYHGAAVLGSKTLRDFLINFSRPFIYTTAMPPDSYRVIQAAYDLIPAADRENLFFLIEYFRKQAESFPPGFFQCNDSPVHSILQNPSIDLRLLASRLNEEGFAMKAILSPTVPAGKERIRISLHAFNTKEEINRMMEALKSYSK